VSAFADVDGSVEYVDAGLIRRGLAWWLDATIAGLITMPLFWTVGSVGGRELGFEGMLGSYLVLGQLGLFVAFVALPLKLDGQTAGQRALKIMVLSQEGGRPSSGQVLIRGLVKLFLMQLCMPFAVASVLMFRQSVSSFGWSIRDGKASSDRVSVGLHDKLARTVAVAARRAAGA
jgi:uncharacterized RDD family membrane protein YckC